MITGIIDVDLTASEMAAYRLIRLCASPQKIYNVQKMWKQRDGNGIMYYRHFISLCKKGYLRVIEGEVFYRVELLK